MPGWAALAASPVAAELGLAPAGERAFAEPVVMARLARGHDSGELCSNVTAHACMVTYAVASRVAVHAAWAWQKAVA
jgi:hypothetical protein